MKSWASTAENYNPAWGQELAWTDNKLFNRPLGSNTFLEDLYTPWWQQYVAHPIGNYDASKLPTGGVRLDSVLDTELTLHRPLQGWTVQKSPSGINNVYAFTPGGTNQQDQTDRGGQNAFFDLGLHPISSISGDIAAEMVGNYDERFWFPVSEEHRMFNDNQHARIVRAEAKYDDGNIMLRGFEGVPLYDWLNQNDLFHLMPSQAESEYYRRLDGSLTPRGGEARIKSPLGTLNVIGGSELELAYGSGVYAKYDAPAWGSWENSFVYRNQNIPFGLEDPDERRWSLSYNSSYAHTERVTSHGGVIYQPFRLHRTYQDPSTVDPSGLLRERETTGRDAFGATARVEWHPTAVVDQADLGYTYLGLAAGNKQQVDADASRSFLGAWTFSSAYIYRQPIVGPVPLMFEGTPSNPGALLAQPHGPDDPFWVQWDNRKAHIGSLTLIYNPTPGTPFFRYQKNVLEDWNVNPDLDTPWAAAIQYRVTHYPTNTDRLYYWDEDRNLLWDPTVHAGALASDHPLSSFTGLVRWRRERWRVTADMSSGEALAGLAQAYTTATDFFKPSTLYVSGGLTVDNGIVKTFARYGQDVWGPLDYFVQKGWTYHKIYEAGLSVVFLKNAEAGFRYVGTRMTNDFIGSNVGAFNEYRFFLTYHFALEHNFASKLAGVGHPLPKTFPEVNVTVSDAQFTPDGSGPTRSVTINPHASADAGLLSWRLFIRSSRGETVRKWEGNGAPPASVQWEGLALDGKPLANGVYRVTLDVADLYGNEATSPAQPVEIQSLAPTPAAPGKGYSVTSTPEGLRVTLSSLILFDVDKVELKESAKESLGQVVDLLKAYPTNVLRVTGHTDSTGRDSYNQNLSERRAQAVGDYLIKKGSIARSRLTVVGYGKRRPVASNATEEGRQKNRRVEIDILK